MNLGEPQNYVLPALLLLFFGWRFWSMRSARSRLPLYLAEGAVVVDVRTESEYARGARPGSLNLPLHQLSSRLGELERSRPVVLCCASGSRSALAARILRKNGFARVLNAGPWTNTLGVAAQKPMKNGKAKPEE